MMATTAEGIDHATAVRRVNETLRGPVADVLIRLVPELKGCPREQIYDRALNDLAMLERVFATFHKERRFFRYIVVDARHRPVEDESVPLSCGRSVRQVVAMVVRTAAKRYFRRALDEPTAHSGDSEETPFTPAEILYEAIKDYLLHEWQVPLVPAYADMTPTQVRILGPRLLDIREMSELRRLIGDPFALDAYVAAAADRTLAHASETEAVNPLLTELLTSDGRRLKTEAFSSILTRPDVRGVLSNPDIMVKVTDILRDVGGIHARLLLTGLGLKADQLAVVLLTAHDAVGPVVFTRLFGQPGQPQLVLRIIQRAIASGITDQTPLGECAAFIRLMFAQASKGRIA